MERSHVIYIFLRSCYQNSLWKFCRSFFKKSKLTWA